MLLKDVKPIATSLPTVHVSDNSKPVLQTTSPLIGRWHLPGNVNGPRLVLNAQFPANGQFQLEVATVDWLGNEELKSTLGTYNVRGNSLMLQTNEGPM